VSPADYKDGLIYTDYRQTGEQNVLCSKTLWVLGNWSRYVRPGFRRVAADLAPARDDVLPSAFVSPDGRRFVIVVVNTSEHDEALQLRVGQDAPSLRRVVTDDTHDLAADQGPTPPGELRIGAGSVVTLLGDVA
ncbi:MAG TPA: glycoside hydrolase family 30 beta sandwich domain-containing protein, partial [Armatimonadota bacterium]|nr:glycoside hydrolase family 30 beta sandwich domain-containing protein [Armatimonadota bacterium]